MKGERASAKNFLWLSYFLGPARIRRTFSGKTKTRCSRTLFPIPRVDRWSSNEVDLCLIERLFVDAAAPPTAPVVVVLIKCLFAIDIVEADGARLPFSCPIFISDDVDIDVLRCWWLLNELGGTIDTFVSADVECDVVILFVVLNIAEDFFAGDGWRRVLRGRIDVSVSHVTDMVLSVAEFERCGRVFWLLLFSFRELLFPPPSLARATCSGTTWVISESWSERSVFVTSNDSGCQWCGHETRLEKSCRCDNTDEDEDDGGCCSDSMVHRCRRREKVIINSSLSSSSSPSSFFCARARWWWWWWRQ